MLYFRNERRHGTLNLKKALFLSHLQPPKDKSSKHLSAFISEFDDVTVKTIYRTVWSVNWGEGGEPIEIPTPFPQFTVRMALF